MARAVSVTCTALSASPASPGISVPFDSAAAFTTCASICCHCSGANNGAIRHLVKQIVIHRIDQIQLRPLLHRLTQTLRHERVILAKYAANDQRGFQAGKIGDRACPARVCPADVHLRGNRIGAGGDRHSRYPVRERAFAINRVLQACCEEKPARRYAERHVFLLPRSIRWQQIQARFASRIPAIDPHALSSACVKRSSEFKPS